MLHARPMKNINVRLLWIRHWKIRFIDLSVPDMYTHARARAGTYVDAILGRDKRILSTW